MDKKSLVVAAIPAFNEERTIGPVVLLAKRHVDMVVVYDDGSTEGDFSATKLISVRLR